jgi:hypothetical protein
VRQGDDAPLVDPVHRELEDHRSKARREAIQARQEDGARAPGKMLVALKDSSDIHE